MSNPYSWIRGNGREKILTEDPEFQKNSSCTCRAAFCSVSSRKVIRFEERDSCGRRIFQGGRAVLRTLSQPGELAYRKLPASDLSLSPAPEAPSRVRIAVDDLLRSLRYGKGVSFMGEEPCVSTSGRNH